MRRICLLTDSRFLDPEDPQPLIRQAIKEEGMLSEELRKLGCRVERIAWDDGRADWGTFDLLVFRSTWDYMDRIGEFRTWLDSTEHLCPMVNPVEIVRWNMDKSYLGELENKGVQIPPSLFLEKGESMSLESIVGQTTWEEVILKPQVSAGARHTHRFRAGQSRAYESIFRELITREAMMIQEFQGSVLSGGELSLVMIGGRYSHAVRKKARPGDFRVQDDFGGSVEAVEADDISLAFARKVMDSCGFEVPYARVDILMDSRGRPQLSELELIEPELWFRLNNKAAGELARSILKKY